MGEDLRTLKDLNMEDGVHGDSNDTIYTDVLRQELIKWIKHFEEEESDSIKTIKKIYPKYPKEDKEARYEYALLNGKKYRTDWIKHFVNIKDEELE